MATVSNLWEIIDKNRAGAKPRPFIRVAQEPDLMIALNYYEPGYKNQFHHHWGTSQSFLVMKGRLTLRTRKGEDAALEVHHLDEGECAVMAAGEYYQLENETDKPLVLYQAKQPTDKLQLLGREPVNAREYFGDAV
jgi:mannose-6-phosphate isomerase-like protein (cupin superfamily)